jgi:hypothetical protein
MTTFSYRSSHWLAGLALLLTGWILSVAPAQAGSNDGQDQATFAGAQARSTLPIEEVRIGMRGYGLTVFAGTKVEPFPVEVISIVNNARPNRDVIWIRCPGQRMQKSGPVQGMSGSPIYLWPETREGEAGDQKIGEGGKLIGAFAFGFSGSKDCIVGVQPIKYMRETGQRAKDGPAREDGPQKVDAGSAVAALKRLQQMTAGSDSPLSDLYLGAFTELVSSPTSRINRPLSDNAGEGPGPSRSLPDDLAAAPTRVEPLLLPMAVGSSDVANVMAPLLEMAGVQPVADQGLIGGAPPPSVRAGEAVFKPGSVLAIPLVFGDVSMAASGTVTDVTDTGTVLGFGHSMFGRGRVALPMATGFVHFIVPRRSTSFKTAAGLQLQGSLVQDEASAVAGIAGRHYQTAPVRVTVNMPGMAEQNYDYSVVDHPALTPMLAPMVALRSVTAIHGLPRKNTMQLTGTLRFTGDREIAIDSTISDGSEQEIMSELLPVISMMMQNQHQRLTLTGADIDVEVQRGIRQATLANARLSEVEVRPGQTVNATLRLQPYGQSIQRQRVQFTIPADLPVGDYQFVISDAQGYLRRYLDSRPHLLRTTNVNELQSTIEKLLAIKRDRIYLMLQLKEKGVAIGRSELPQLPSSRKAILTSPTSTAAIPFKESIEKTIASDYVLQGELKFRLHVRQPNRAVRRDQED